LGGGPSNIFAIEIALTKDVIALKKAIKDEKKNAFDTVDADSLNLWDVSCLTPGLRSNANDLIFGRSTFLSTTLWSDPLVGLTRTSNHYQSRLNCLKFSLNYLRKNTCILLSNVHLPVRHLST
jgi:hypothetical protein